MSVLKTACLLNMILERFIEYGRLHEDTNIKGHFIEGDAKLFLFYVMKNILFCFVMFYFILFCFYFILFCFHLRQPQEDLPLRVHPSS